jgi:hypothetical protein
VRRVFDGAPCNALIDSVVGGEGSGPDALVGAVAVVARLFVPFAVVEDGVHSGIEEVPDGVKQVGVCFEIWFDCGVVDVGVTVASGRVLEEVAKGLVGFQLLRELVEIGSGAIVLPSGVDSGG